jgi:hypothetical protein
VEVVYGIQYTFMPDWYWNIEKREAEYQKYKEKGS